MYKLRSRLVAFFLVFFLVFNFGVGQYNVAHATGAEFALTAGGFALSAGAVGFAVVALAGAGVIYGGYKFSKSDLYNRIKAAAKSLTVAQIKKWNDWGATTSKKIKVKGAELRDAGLGVIASSLASQVNPSVKMDSSTGISAIGKAKEEIDRMAVKGLQDTTDFFRKNKIEGVGAVTLSANVGSRSNTFGNWVVWQNAGEYRFLPLNNSPYPLEGWKKIGVCFFKTVDIRLFNHTGNFKTLTTGIYTSYIIEGALAGSSQTIFAKPSYWDGTLIASGISFKGTNSFVGEEGRSICADLKNLGFDLEGSKSMDFPAPLEKTWSYPLVKNPNPSISIPEEVVLPVIDGIPTNWEDSFPKDVAGTFDLPYENLKVDNPTLTKDVSVEIPINPSIPADPSIPVVPDLGGILEFLKNLVALPTKQLDFKPLMKGVVNKFPFCVPFDFVNAITTLKADRKVPVYKVEFIKGAPLVLDFEPFDSMARVIRSVILLVFVIWLIVATRGLIKG